MTTVAELITYLQTLPQDAQVKVTSNESRRWEHLFIPNKLNPDGSDTCWFDADGNELSLGEK
jgi:hypothetical protein